MGLKKGENPPLPPAGTELFHSWEEPGFRIRARPVMLGGEHEIEFHVADQAYWGYCLNKSALNVGTSVVSVEIQQVLIEDYCLNKNDYVGT